MIKRRLLQGLKDHLRKKEISLIIGPRQAGKTTLMSLLQDELNKQGEKTLFLNLDFEEDREFFSSQAKLLSKIRLEIGTKKGYIFIDEIQRKQDAGLFLKGIYDRSLPYKFIVSGSGSIELKERIHESLVGRKQVFELNTLSFEEFVDFKTGYRYEDRLSEFFEIEKERTFSLLEEYLNFGGYPRVVLEDELKDKRRIVDDIFRSYLERDISSFLRVEKLESYYHLIRLMASQIGNLVNYHEISGTVGISLPTLKNYLWYAEKTFVLHKITPYFTNIRKEITKSPVYYFCDLGLRNYTSGVFGQLKMPSDSGFVFQNFIINVLREKIRFSGAKIHFWRTKDGAEVDFIIDSGKRQIPIEVKYQRFKKPDISRSLISFIKRHRPRDAFVINLSMDGIHRMDKTTIHFLPFSKFIYSNHEL
ncbi:MAG: ATP-binding protein [Deltaproteobacteria bacterium]|nr:ATP-binding protein [Deltaproteobacteria bacterium]